METCPELPALEARVQELRKERGFPHEQFNADFEMPRAYYGGIERGEHNGATLNPQVEKKYTGRRGEDEE